MARMSQPPDPPSRPPPRSGCTESRPLRRTLVATLRTIPVHLWVACYLASLLALLAVQLSVPVGYPEQWAGPSRLPDQAVRVSALYREAYHLPRLPLSSREFYLAHLGIHVALWATYTLAVLGSERIRGHRTLWLLTLPIVLLCVALPPILSTDVFYYGVTGQIAGPYGANPYTSVPDDFPRSALLPFTYWTDFPSPYGPLWTAVCAAVA